MCRHTTAGPPANTAEQRQTPFVAIQGNNRERKLILWKEQSLVRSYLHILTRKKDAAPAAPGILVMLRHLFLLTKHFTGLYKRAEPKGRIQLCIHQRLLFSACLLPLRIYIAGSPVSFLSPEKAIHPSFSRLSPLILELCLYKLLFQYALPEDLLSLQHR